MCMQKTSKQIIYLGVDIGKAEHARTLVNQSGRILEEGTVPNKPARLAGFAKRPTERFETLFMGCEATGSYYEKIAIAFSDCHVPY